jgi:hypothetical protein
MFLKIIFTSGFISKIAKLICTGGRLNKIACENYFQKHKTGFQNIKILFYLRTGLGSPHPQLSACKNDDFYQ